MNKSLLVGLIIGAIAISLVVSAMTTNTVYGTADGGTDGGTDGGSGRAIVNCLHCAYSPCLVISSLHNCRIKAVIETAIITTLTDEEEGLRLFSNPLANVNVTAKVPANVSSLPANITDIPTSIINIDPLQNDVVELDCKYERSTQEISDCDVLAIIQTDRNNPDEIRMIQNPILTLNPNVRLPINTTSLLPYNNSELIQN